MGIGDYMCVTLRGGAPWGFTLKEGAGETYRPLLVSQVEEGGPASLAGVKDGDEMVSLNGEPCADLTLSQAVDVVDASADCLQLLIRRCCSVSAEEEEPEEMCPGQGSDATTESTTLHIFSSEQRCQSPRELFIPASQDEAFYDLNSNRAVSKGPELVCTELRVSSPADQRGQEPDQERCFSPGDLVELQVSVQTSSDGGCASLGSALGILGEPSNREAADMVHKTTTGVLQLEPGDLRQPLKQLGMVVGSPEGPGREEGAQEHLQGSEGRGMTRVGGPEVSGRAGSQSEGEGGGGCEGDPRSFSVSFGTPSDDGTPAEEQDSDSEGDPDKPHKHHARHSRLRRCESLSEKQVKEAKSKCKRIALLLTTAPSNPNNKGVLMFKKHRQRAKKYTLVSYGTGEDEPESSDEEDGEGGEPCTVEFTLVATSDSEIDKHFQTNSKSVLAVSLDKGLLEIERNLNNQAEMECLPETKGKGAVMFAQRRQRMDEIAAEHEELRRHGIPVEGIQEAEKNLAEQSYMQSAAESHVYMDVSAHQQSQQQQYQQYYEQQQYQQQQYPKEYQQQQQHYEQQHFQQQQMYQQQQAYGQEQQMQHYSTNINGTVQHQTSEMQTTFSNRTAKPFSVENMAAVPYSPPASGFTQDSFGHGEQIASRDERISTPAIKTGVLMEGRKRNTAKPMFTFKERPKVSPNPALLNLLNKGDKKLGFESGPEEDYLSLGAEACNFLQSSLKNKNPPPVAPKPAVNPTCLPWSTQTELANQAVAQQPENGVSTPTVVPIAESAPASELEPTPAPVAEPSPPPAPQGVPVSATTMDPHTLTLPEPEPQEQSLQVTTEEDNVAAGLSQPAPQTTWAVSQVQTQQQQSSHSWHQVQPQEVAASQSPSQPPWIASQSPQAQVQPPTLTSTWSPQNQLSWNPPVEQARPPTHAHPTWGHPQEQRQAQPPWAQSQPPNMQPTPPAWGQPQDQQVQKQQPQAPWVEPPQAQPHHHQPPWIQPQQKVQAQPPWGQLQPEVQQQPPWVQQHQAPQQEWAQAQAPGQPQQPWMSAQRQQPQQPSTNAWPPSQTQAQTQPPWVQPSQVQVPAGPEANVNPWAPVPAKAQAHPPWAQSSAEHGQQSTTQTQQQAPWAQPVSPQTTPQPSQRPPMSTWGSAQTPPQTAVNTWTPQLQRAPPNVSTSAVNTRPSPKPWTPPQNAPQSQSHPPPPQRMHSYTIAHRASPPINPMATVLNPSSQSSPLNLPAVRGKGADMFVKRQSRMEKFVVDSETVEANKASRSTSPAASLPNEWKYTPNVRAPPSRAYNPIQSPFYPPAATKQPPSSSPSTKAKNKGKQKETPPPKPLNVVDVMKHQPYQLNSSLFIFGAPVETEKPKAAPSLPNPPVENQQVRYEQMPPVQAGGPYNVPCSQAAFGIPMQPTMHDGHYQPNPPDMYPPPNPYQQPPVAYQQAYDQQYQQPIPPAYNPQTPQGSIYQHPPQAPYQPANSPPYLATPSLPFQPQPPSSYAGPNVAVAAKAESVSGGSTAPKPKFTAKKSSAQIWKPAAVDKE
ncbi:synaptopodin-2 isoform X1 [Takifugu flavidus]|uniref:synaptopodin-2 isoform X1 n=1 Tax=Takifugu flavidus TaxID=433684 RepID=UPI002543FF85|nr:synaptopodin-2 isoform X1 [Takifugu flavidus]